MKNEDFSALVAKAINLTIAQGKPSVTEEGKCVYLNPQGLRCVIGQVLPTDVLQEVLADYPSGHIGFIIENTTWGANFNCTQKMELLSLQECHDGASPTNFVESFTLGVAKAGLAWK